MGNPIYSTEVLAEKYKEQCIDYITRLKLKGFRIVSSQMGVVDHNDINISPFDYDPLETLKTYWKQTEDQYKQSAFKAALSELNK